MEIDVEALTEAVRKRQVLYDKSDEDYSNRVLINQRWIEVAEEVGIDDATARKKWSVLRDSFRRYHKKDTTFKSGSGGKCHRPWYLYKNMLFLLPFVEDGKASTTTNLIEGPEAEQEPQQASQLLEDNMDTMVDNDASSQGGSSLTNPRPGPSHTPDIPTSTASKQHTRKRPYPPYPQDRGSTISPFDAAILEALKGLQQQQQQKPPQDDDAQFLLSLLPVMKGLDPITKFEFRGELNNTALRYLRRSKQPSPQYENNDYISRTSTPSSTSSTAIVDNAYQYSQYVPTTSGSQVDPTSPPPPTRRPLPVSHVPPIQINKQCTSSFSVVRNGAEVDVCKPFNSL